MAQPYVSALQQLHAEATLLGLHRLAGNRLPEQEPAVALGAGRPQSALASRPWHCVRHVGILSQGRPVDHQARPHMHQVRRRVCGRVVGRAIVLGGAGGFSMNANGLMCDLVQTLFEKALEALEALLSCPPERAEDVHRNEGLREDVFPVEEGRDRHGAHDPQKEAMIGLHTDKPPIRPHCPHAVRAFACLTHPLPLQPVAVAEPREDEKQAWHGDLNDDHGHADDAVGGAGGLYPHEDRREVGAHPLVPGEGAADETPEAILVRPLRRVLLQARREPRRQNVVVQHRQPRPVAGAVGG